MRCAAWQLLVLVRVLVLVLVVASFGQKRDQ